MKINSADFPVERRIRFASEDGLVYDDPKSRIEETWDALADYYIKKAEVADAAATRETEFYRCIAQCNVENTTALTVYQLESQQILASYRTTEAQAEDTNIKPYIIGSIRTILENRRRELEENMRTERAIWDKIRSIRQEVRLVDDEVRVYFDSTNYMRLEKAPAAPEHKSKGLSCRICCRGIAISCYARREGMGPYDEAQEHFYEQKTQQSFRRNGLSVEIGQDASCGTNAVCAAVLAELRQGARLADLCSKIVAGLSRYMLSKLLGPHEPAQVLETDGPTAADGRSLVFFAITASNVFKVVRSEASFDIYMNGFQIKFRSKRM